MSQNKSPEESICNASLIRNVWEIRTKSHTIKLKTEEERVSKSALKQINEEWQMRMTTERKAPPRLQQKSRHSDNTALQNYLNKPFLSYTSRNSEFSNSKLQNQRGLFSKRVKNISDIYHDQPSLLKWGKSWKFSRPTLHMEEEAQAKSVSDWGKSWKFSNLQPDLEGQTWSEQDLYNDDLDFQQHNDTTFLSKEVKSNAFSRSQSFEESLCLSEWEPSWKFSKHPSHEEESLSEEEQFNTSMDIETDEDMCQSKGNILLDSYLHENEMSEWRDSWKVSKPEETDYQSVELEPEEAVDHEFNEDETPVSKWCKSWMILYHELPKNKSQSSDWSESWKLLHVPSQQENDNHTDEDLSEESSDIDTFESMFLPTRDKMNMLLTSQDCSVSEWSRSWEITKPQAQALSQNDQKHKTGQHESEEILDFRPEKENCVIIKSKSRQFLSPQFFSDELSTIDWGEFMMMHDKAQEVTLYSNDQLFNTWQARVNHYEEKETSEKERRRKSALPQ
ncbi:uncharacterized protein LOC133141574 [Conger conger]|uniref:uncharacterized protein LOC133141574 n=1 Tax=Conger conger TaxID=82655 RepID=UPI002A5A3F5D|nr:uncharacterized protein LOC133141574 [Conger conger]